MEGGNLLDTWINGAADFRFFLGVGRIVAEFCVANKTILQPERIDRFGKARSQGHDATNRLRNPDGTTGFIRDLVVHRGSGRAKGSTLSTGGRRPQEQSSCCKSHRLEKLLGQAAHESPTPRKVPLSNKKAPRDRFGAFGIALSREERGPLRHGRVAWLTALEPITVAGPRPIHTAFPATLACKLNFECKPRLRECQRKTGNGTIGFEVSQKWRGCQRFFQLGLRFSTRARRPSCESSRR